MKPLQQSDEVSTNEITLFNASSGVFNSEDMHTIILAEEDVDILSNPQQQTGMIYTLQPTT